MTRIVSPEEAQTISEVVRHLGAGSLLKSEALDLAYTVAVLGEQRESVLALHHGTNVRRVTPWDDGEEHYCGPCNVAYPCPTARALGVTE